MLSGTVNIKRFTALLSILFLYMSVFTGCYTQSAPKPSASEPPESEAATQSSEPDAAKTQPDLQADKQAEMQGLVIETESAEYEEIASEFMKAYADIVMRLPKNHTLGGSDFKTIKMEVTQTTVSDNPKGFIITASFAVKPTGEYGRSGWWAGNGKDGSGTFSGYVVSEREIVLEKTEPNKWRCTGAGTGGYGGFGYLCTDIGKYPADSEKTLYSCLQDIGEGTIGEEDAAHIILEELYLIDWSNYLKLYGDDGVNELLSYISKYAIGESQTTRTIYVMMGSKTLPEQYAEKYREILEKIRKTDEKSYQYCLTQISQDNAAVVNTLLKAKETDDDKKADAGPSLPPREDLSPYMEALIYGADGKALPESTAVTYVASPRNTYVVNDKTGKASPKGAALALVELMMEHMGQDENLNDPSDRTFIITEYKNLKVDVFSTIWVREAASGYGITDAEYGSGKWIVEFSCEFKYKGFFDLVGYSDGSRWLEGIYQGGPCGFLMVKNGDSYSLTSRFSRLNRENDVKKTFTADRDDLDKGIYAESNAKRTELPYFSSGEALFNGVKVNVTTVEDMRGQLGKWESEDKTDSQDGAETVYRYMNGMIEYHAFGDSQVIGKIVIKDTSKAAAPRGIRIGDSVESVMSQFPYESDPRLDPDFLFYGGTTDARQSGMYRETYDSETGVLRGFILLEYKPSGSYMRIDFTDGKVSSITISAGKLP